MSSDGEPMRGGAERAAPDAARPRAGIGPAAGGGRYQVWHANDIEAVEQSRMEGQPYVHGHTLVGSVEAADLAQAVKRANDVDRPGWQNPEAGATVIGAPRFTLDGDVIVDPQGQAHRIEMGGRFREIGEATGSRIGGDAKAAATPPHPWPSEIARANRDRASQGRGPDQGQDRDAGMKALAVDVADFVAGEARAVMDELNGCGSGQPLASTGDGQAGRAAEPPHPWPSEIAKANGQMLTQEKSWQEKEIEREKARKEGNADTDSYRRDTGRWLPEEERRKQKEEEKGGGLGL